MAAHSELNMNGVTFSSLGPKREREYWFKRTDKETEEMLTDQSVVEFLWCVEQLRAAAPYNKHATKNSVGSYTLKHWLEKGSPWSYITNGTCITAVLHIGIPYKREDATSPNINIALRADWRPTIWPGTEWRHQAWLEDQAHKQARQARKQARKQAKR
jgi:hypothetical protein